MKGRSLKPDMGVALKLPMSTRGLYAIKMLPGKSFVWIQEGRLRRQTQMQPLQSRLLESEAPLRKCVAINHHLDIAAEHLSVTTGIFQILTFRKTTKCGVGECNYEKEAEAGKGGSVSEVRKKKGGRIVSDVIDKLIRLRHRGDYTDGSSNTPNIFPRSL
ncbi:hypothetical protein CEXT_510061 [Caerostris extrusa]|uniref:Uncharacterized protein n=1 Tax=Caerostris extrusa TaxID=172846 RepID=A0AAV4XVP9_CAEEX|nr:hypothetical protein CEXT_510061 [Caerostris extrusa]